MPLVPFRQLMQDAECGNYAVGYFESWNLESLLAVADAAEAVRSPVILGFSGIYLPHPQRQVRDPLGVYAAMGLEVGRGLSVPCCLLFNELPHLDCVLNAIELGYQLVMYTDDTLDTQELEERVRRVTMKAHDAGIAVEGEPMPLPGVAGDLPDIPTDGRLTNPDHARHFVESTSVDALAVNVGQAHLHGRRTVRLDLDRVRQLRDVVSVPLVLHGASSVARDDLRQAIRLGVRKINVGSVLKQAYFRALCRACGEAQGHGNPYEIVGSGLAADVLVAARMTVRAEVEDLMRCFGSAGRAGGQT